MAREKEKIKINPKILEWALKNVNYDIDSFASKMKKKESVIKDWLSGDDQPTYSQLEIMSYKVLHIPLVVFFLDEPPEENIKGSFRSGQKEALDDLSPSMMQIIRKSKAFQLDLAELCDNKNMSDNFLLEKIDRNINKENIKDIAKQVRSILGVPIELQKEVKNIETALQVWRDVVEKHGIFIRKDAFRNDDISGFCLYDDTFPIIVLNNSTAKARQIFTIFHEIAHLILKTSAIYDISNEDSILNENKDTEVICNKFASEILLPSEEFINIIDNKKINERIIQDLAKLFSVSKDVVARKCLDYQYIDKNEYNSYVFKWTKEYEEYSKKKTSSGGNHYDTKFTCLGENYIKMVFASFYSNKIDEYKVADYLSVKTDKIYQMESRLLKKESK